MPIALREGFGQQPELYDKARPRYPEALFDTLIEQTGLEQDAKLLEIGPGPGIATRPLAERGFSITAVERSPAMAATARRRLAPYPKVKVITGAFEEAKLPDNNFDLVFAATSLHWVNEAERFSKPHRLLKQAGHLAIINTNYLTDGHGDRFYEASKPIYEHYAPKTNMNQVNLTPGLQEDLPARQELVPSRVDPELFKQTFFKVFPFYKSFRTREYLDWFSTLSTNLALPAGTRRRFFGEMAELIEEDFGGQISWHFGMSLTIAERL